MASRSGPIYESRVFVEPESIDDYDAWLEQQLTGARETAGVVEAVSFNVDPDARGRPGRAHQFTLDDDEALERFVDGFATDLEAAARAEAERIARAPDAEKIAHYATAIGGELAKLVSTTSPQAKTRTRAILTTGCSFA